MKQLNSEYQLGRIVPNIAALLKRNVNKFSGRYVYFEKNSEEGYQGIKWEKFYQNIENIAYNLKKAGFKKGEKMVLFSRNRLEMLEMELAIMAY